MEKKAFRDFNLVFQRNRLQLCEAFIGRVLFEFCALQKWLSTDFAA